MSARTRYCTRMQRGNDTGRFKGLKVARRNVCGELLSQAEFKKARLLTLDRARALWNKMDKSEVARYCSFTFEAEGAMRVEDE